MLRAIFLTFFFLFSVAANAGDGICISTAVKPGDKQCSGIGASKVVADSRKGSVPQNTITTATVPPDPYAANNVPVPVGVVIELPTAKRKPIR